MNPDKRERKIQTPEQRRASADLLRHSVRDTNTARNIIDNESQKITSGQAEAEAMQQYHEAWQKYYQKYYERYYLTQLENQRGKYTETESERTKRIRSDLLEKFSSNAKRFRKSSHFRPILIGVIVVLVVLFIQFNQVFLAGWHNLISPNSGNDSGIIIADGVGTEINKSPTILIPKLSVNAPIIFNLPNLYESTAQANLRKGAIHYPIKGASAHPGQNGNTVILGHSSGNVFDDNPFKFLFIGLERLSSGDLFYIDYQGKRYTYRVERKEVISPNNLAKLKLGNSQPYATLVTCVPIGTNINRLLVIGRQISPDPSNASEGTNTGSQVENITGNQPTLFERIFR